MSIELQGAGLKTENVLSFLCMRGGNAGYSASTINLADDEPIGIQLYGLHSRILHRGIQSKENVNEISQDGIPISRKCKLHVI